MGVSNSERLVSVSVRGQVTIPKEFREELGIEVPGWVKFTRTEDGDVVVRPIQSVTDLRGILSVRTDVAGQTATERLSDNRERDAADEAALRGRADDEDSM